MVVILKRIQREKQTITAMINIYCSNNQCSNHHVVQAPICEQCQHLLDYAHKRLDNCPFHDTKPACNHCQVHCYSQKMKEQVKQVMRYSGPRMILKHPLLSLWHLIDTLREIPVLKRSKLSDD